MTKNALRKETKHSDILKTTLVVLIVGILLGTTATFFQEAYGERPLTKNQKKQCENLYFSFKKLGEQQFINNFTFKLFIKQCVNLYYNPEWTFNGKDMIDLFYEKQNFAKYTVPPVKDVFVSITKKYQIDNTRHVISFEGCTQTTKMLSVFLVTSDTEKFIATSQKLVPKDSCSTYWTNVKAQSPDSIGIEYFNDHLNYPNLPKKILKN